MLKLCYHSTDGNAVQEEVCSLAHRLPVRETGAQTKVPHVLLFQAFYIVRHRDSILKVHQLLLLPGYRITEW